MHRLARQPARTRQWQRGALSSWPEKPAKAGLVAAARPPGGAALAASQMSPRSTEGVYVRQPPAGS
jgi:hypothetical protein